MDPFLPGDIPVMVLRYLAVNHCEASVFSLVDEMPILKVHIPAKPPRVSNADYLRHLSRSSVNLGLKEMLTDYMNAKFLVEDLLQNEDGDSMYSSFDGRESLVSKVKALQEVSKTAPARLRTSSRNSPATKMTRSVETETFETPRVDLSTNTDENYECPQCLATRNKVLATKDMACQTEEYTAVRCGVTDDIPIMFYKNLLNDNELQQKIAQTINGHRQGSHDGDVVKKAETEIDKFLTDMLKDMQDDCSEANDGNLAQNLLPLPNFVDEDSNLFHEAQMLFGGNLHGQVEITSDLNLNNVPPETAGLANAAQLTQPPPQQQSTNLTTPGSSPKSANSQHTSSVGGTRVNFEGLNQETQLSDIEAPRPSPRTGKRITPTPLHSTHVNPVFNSSVVIETKNVKVGENNTTVSIKKTNIEPQAWGRLKRRSIVPKTPGMQKSLNPPEKVRVIRTYSDSPLIFGPVGNDKVPANLQNNQLQQQLVTEQTGSLSTRKQNPDVISSAHKRKATPIKLTPEKARNDDYNFMHVYHEGNKSPSSSSKRMVAHNEEKHNSSTSNTRTPTTTLLTTTETEEPNKLGRNINFDNIDSNSDKQDSVITESQSQSKVTPMHLLPPSANTSSEELTTISPTALQRLIASANRISCSTGPSASFMNKKKSLSTPRKRNHIRNLVFATPPSLKEVTSGSLQTSAVNGGKRKASEELLPVEFRSKKRLNWPENDKKDLGKEKASSKPHVEIQNTSTSESLMLPESKVPSGSHRIEKEKLATVPKSNLLSISSQLPTEDTTQQTTKAKANQSLPMPTILEESLQQENPKRGRKGKQKKQTAPKKPKITLSVKDLFGESPAKSTSMKVPSPSKVSKLPPDVVAAQAVASQAVPLGLPRRSPRKLSSDPVNKRVPPPTLPPASSNIPSEIVESRIETEPTPTVLVLQHLQSQIVQQNESSCSIPFSIVPAPLGFPEPTPIKNFAETGFLNISDLQFRSPLITPLKSIPPTPHNDTQFTLPPTPRIIDDQDSNSNSAQSFKLIYDGLLYPANLLTSTPMKLGVPKTPGRSSNSSNSRSPILPEKLLGVQIQIQESNQPAQKQPSDAFPCPPTSACTFVATTSVTVAPVTVTQAIVAETMKDSNTMSPEKKSDGEISSSDEEDQQPMTKSKQIPPLYRKPIPEANKIPIKSPPVSAVVQPRQRQHMSKPTPSTAATTTVQLKYPPVTHPFVSNDTSTKMQKLDFQVGGRDKKLTFSEQETLYSLLQIGGNAMELPHAQIVRNNGKKENRPTPLTTSTAGQLQEKPTVEHSSALHKLLPNKGLGSLIKYVHRTKAQQPPKNN